MHTLPVDRALSIYSALADRSERKGARERLSSHLKQLYIDGERNQHRLTVHGLSYLSGKRLQKLKVRARSLLLRLPLLAQRIAARDFRLCGANRIRS